MSDKMEETITKSSVYFSKVCFYTPFIINFAQSVEVCLCMYGYVTLYKISIKLLCWPGLQKGIY